MSTTLRSTLPTVREPRPYPGRYSVVADRTQWAHEAVQGAVDASAKAIESSRRLRAALRALR